MRKEVGIFTCLAAAEHYSSRRCQSRGKTARSACVVNHRQRSIHRSLQSLQPARQRVCLQQLHRIHPKITIAPMVNEIQYCFLRTQCP